MGMSKKKKKKQGFHPEAKALLLVGAALFLFFSLFSFVSARPEANWLGISGHYTAFLCLYLLGLPSFFLSLFLMHAAFLPLYKKKKEPLPPRVLAFSFFLFSLCLLLNQIAENFPEKASYLQNKVHTESLLILSETPQMNLRYNLGGVPIYFLYKDLPFFPLQRLLSEGGCILFSLVSLITSFVLLTRFPLSAFLQKGVQRIYVTTKKLKKLAPLWKKKLFSSLFLKKSKKGPSIHVAKPLPVSLKLSEAPPAPVSKTENKVTIHTMKASPTLVEAKKAPPLSSDYTVPPLSLLSDPKPVDHPTLKKDLTRQASILEETLKNFGIEAKVVEIHCGPAITSFEVQPPVGVKVQKIKTLENDIALNLEAKSIRILAPIPGKAVVGVEMPALHPQPVSFKEMLLHYQQKHKKLQIPILLGKTVTGENVIADLAKMPHCLIAGATGSGKSVCINTLVMSLLMNASPHEIKFLMIDPKKVELTQYSNLPHMIAPVISEAHGAYAALQWLVREMQKRYDLLKHLGLRNITAFNHRKQKPELEETYPTPIPAKLPFLVAIIDEFADLMMVSSSDLETPIARIAQMARAVGIHLILATQRPSREVITGIIKANFPTRIAFKVSSRINSQIILDEVGAESLLGNGDMLFLPPGSSNLLRAQGAYISDEEITRCVQAIGEKAPPNYLISSFDTMAREEKSTEESSGKDALYEQALTIVLSTKNASTTFLQRKLKIGYARAASLIDELEEKGVIGPQEGSKPRKVLASSESLYARDIDSDTFS